jgi:ribulose kinase
MLYLATIQALAYSTRHILEEIEAARRAHTQQEQQCTLTTLVVCGGLSQSQLYVHELTNALGVDVIVPTCDGMLAGMHMHMHMTRMTIKRGEKKMNSIQS